MEMDQILIDKLKSLPVEKKQEALDFIEFLEKKVSRKLPRQTCEGLWKDLKINITSEDIEEVRREMWGEFPRKDF